MKNLYDDIEELLPTQLENLAGTVGNSGLSLAGVNRRMNERARNRRRRHALAGATLALVVLGGAGAIRMQDPDSGRRVISGGRSGLIAPAAQPEGLRDNSGGPQPASDDTSTPTGAVVDAAAPTTSAGSGSPPAPVVEAKPDQKPIGAQTPDPVKNAPATPEPALNSGLTSRGSSVAPGPADALEVPPPSGQLDPVRGCGISTGPASCPAQPVGPTALGPATSPASVAPAKNDTSTAASHVAPANYGPAEPPQP